jgi:hypothetical protein
MRAVDTNLLVRLITRDDKQQVAAADAFIASGAWVPHLALAEALHASLALILGGGILTGIAGRKALSHLSSAGSHHSD